MDLSPTDLDHKTSRIHHLKQMIHNISEYLIGGDDLTDFGKDRLRAKRTMHEDELFALREEMKQ